MAQQCDISLYEQSLILSSLARDVLSNNHHPPQIKRFLSKMEVDNINLQA